jgi:zinc protease
MNSRSRLVRTGLTAVILFLFAGLAAAQKTPRQEKLLNGLKLIMIDDRTADKVSLRVRIHAGSAFDPQGKEGVMRLLADSIFPTPESREFFTDDLGGSIEIVSSYDYIQVNATAKPSEFLRLLESVSTAVANPTIDKETVERLKKERLDALAKVDKDSGYVADEAALARLFGTFPYGRPELGTPGSVQKIDFADLRFAKDRFFGADNATVVISGNFDPNLGFRAARRFLGAWLKSDNKVPATFRQPDEPDTKLVEVGAGTGSGVYRFAFRGVSKADKDWAAGEILERIYTARLAPLGTAAVENRARLLPGVFVISLNSPTPVDAAAVAKLIGGSVTEAEFAAAKREVDGAVAKWDQDDRWLDADTYKIGPDDRAKWLQTVTLTDVQRVSDRLLKNPMVSVVVRRTAN